MSDTDHPNVQLIKQAEAYIAAGDLPGLLSLLTDDPPAIYRIPGHNQMSGVYVGKEAIAHSFVKLSQLNVSLRVTADDVVADDDHAFMMWSGTVDRGERHLEARGAMAFKVLGGKLSEAWFLYDDQDAYEAFYS